MCVASVERIDKVACALVQSIIGPILVIIRVTLVAQLIGDGRSRHSGLNTIFAIS